MADSLSEIRTFTGAGVTGSGGALTTMTKKQKTKWEERERRLRLVIGWITAGMLEDEALTAQVMSEFNYDHRARAEKLISDARRVLAGERNLSDLRGGRPREYVRKVDINDLRALSNAAHALDTDMTIRPGAYRHSRAEVQSLILHIKGLAAKLEVEPA